LDTVWILAMLRRLRFQLSLLYLLAAAGLVLLIGGGSYLLLRYYLQETTDLALEYKMAQQFHKYGLALPEELQRAERTWLENNAHLTHGGSVLATLLPSPTPRMLAEEEGEYGESSESGESGAPAQQSALDAEISEEAFDGDLAAIFISSLDVNGNIIPGSQVSAAPLFQDKEASLVAMQQGSDRRTTRLPDDNRVRLLTYRVDVSGGPALLQVGRVLRDQQRVMDQFLTTLWILGGLSVFLLGAGSWWLSGRSIKPVQQAWEQQQVFVSNASHELRTPLTLIKATAEVGLRGQPGAAQQEALQDVRQEVDYMNRLVDDLLLLSRMDTHRLKLSREPIELKPLLDEVRSQADKLAVDRGIQLLEGQAQGAVLGDPTHLRQVLLILIDNALRYTPAGGTVRLETRASGRQWQILVSDTGYGIPAKDLPHIFDRFYQVSQPGVDDNRSNGLGLSIARGLMEAQGGSIFLESQEGSGTLAVLSMPALSLSGRS
jgi:signal transduction histidine kinase